MVSFRHLQVYTADGEFYAPVAAERRADAGQLLAAPAVGLRHRQRRRQALRPDLDLHLAHRQRHPRVRLRRRPAELLVRCAHLHGQGLHPQSRSTSTSPSRPRPPRRRWPWSPTATARLAVLAKVRQRECRRLDAVDRLPAIAGDGASAVGVIEREIWAVVDARPASRWPTPSRCSTQLPPRLRPAAASADRRPPGGRSSHHVGQPVSMPARATSISAPHGRRPA